MRRRPLHKLLVCAALVACSVSTAQAHHFEVGPVIIDPSKIAKDTENFLQSMTQWTTQLQAMNLNNDASFANQQLMDQQFQTMTGKFMLGTIFNNINQALPDNWQAAFNAIPQQGTGALTADAQSIYAAAQIFNRCTQSDPAQARLCEATAVHTAQTLANINVSLQNIEAEHQQIALLKCQTDLTRDAKASHDLISRMAAEQANIIVQASMLTIYKFSDQKQGDFIDELKQQQAAQSLARPEGIPSTVSTFP
jgi:type IV secretion system protein VirB5